jgi:hypothetical protein
MPEEDPHAAAIADRYAAKAVAATGCDTSACGGQLRGRWRDVVLLERRSAVAGR